jgi:ABC-type transporter Mla subunit MlaD
MALQDLTPQLRTRLGRMERAVGWFVILATALLALGFGYYIYQTAKSRGWFLTKATYFTLVHSADGLKIGDPIQLMGFEAGTITDIKPQPPMDFTYNVYIEFEIKEPYYGYMWTMGSRAKVAAADLLGKRVLEVTKGTGGHATYIAFPVQEMTLAAAKNISDPKRRLAEDIYRPGTTQMLARAFSPLTNLDAIAAIGVTEVRVLDMSAKRNALRAMWNLHDHRYDTYAPGNKFWLEADESPALGDRLESVVGQVEAALPNILNLTNQIATVLSNSANLTSSLNRVASDARPAVSNLAVLTAQLNRPGALGEWLLPTNIYQELENVLDNANGTLAGANTNLPMLLENLNQSLIHLSDITSNLNNQVQMNTNILSAISKTVVDADDFVQGLKRHWLLRSAFKTRNTNAPPVNSPQPLRSPKGQSQQ